MIKNFFKKRYYYCVSYEWWRGSREQGKSCCEVILTKPIRLWSDVELITDLAKRKINVDKVVINNYQLLRKGR